ncbi:MAG TPA: superoxide dismutase [Phycisphaerales bacterium]|nr:superoxide dismutase [Phycisphaerales bacterium]
MENGTTGMDRRTAMGALGAMGLLTVGAAAMAQNVKGGGTETGSPKMMTDHPLGPPDALGWDPAKGEYVLPKLQYPYEALEPHIDAETMKIHHTKHHQAYVTGLNKAIGELKKAREGGDYGLVKHWQREMSFHGGGHFNHTIFWAMMAPSNAGGGGKPSGKLADAIARDFGSFESFSGQFQAAANAVEGSGWAWLAFDHVSRRLLIVQLEKHQDQHLTVCVPLMGVDVWEHAYYLKYRNVRADYVKAFMNVIAWEKIGRAYEMVGH